MSFSTAGLIALCAVGFSWLNRLRGTKSYYVWLLAAALGGLVYYVSLNWVAAIVTGLAMVIGENWGWTKWINCIKGDITQEQYNERWLDDDTGKTNGTYHLAQAFIDEKKDYFAHCCFGMFLRGMWWWVPVFAALGFYGLVHPAAGFVTAFFLSVAFPQVYYWAWRLPEIWGQGYLRRAEYLYGALYGLMFGLVLFY